MVIDIILWWEVLCIRGLGGRRKGRREGGRGRGGREQEKESEGGGGGRREGGREREREGEYFWPVRCIHTCTAYFSTFATGACKPHTSAIST